MKIWTPKKLGFRFWSRRKAVVSFKSSDSVALTFDDGPDPIYTPRVLEVLRRHGAHATFFVLGRQAELYPRVVQQIVNSSCEIANHSYSHPSFSLISLKERMDEITKCQATIGQRGKPYFRPPFGHANFATPIWASLLGFRTVCWSAHGGDWASSNPDEVVQDLESSVTPGSIVLLHDRLETATDSCFFERDAMIEALDQFLGKSDLAFKTLTEMFDTCEPVEGDWDTRVTVSQLQMREQEFLSLETNTP